ncbi:MAG: T9SS type A sorting domain-containing protein [Crocinitomicaceae bacterium]|nr:T9SS type A sorting domain-containing protein [Crocinitomicaceae bacterium]
MKRITTSIIVFAVINLIALDVNAQNVNIPDANFKAYLVGNTAINTNADTEIQISEATAFSGQIACSNLGITDMTGLEEFTSLTILQCIQNNFATLDVSQNTALTLLNCGNSGLTTLDVSQNLALQHLICDNTALNSIDVSQNSNLLNLKILNNSVTTLDVSQNPLLTYLRIDGNNIGALDLSMNPNLTAMECSGNNLTELNLTNISTSTLTIFDASSNPNLSCIQVDDVAAATAVWTNIDPASSFSLDCSIYVSSITVQGEAGLSAITNQGGTLQMEADVLPLNADDNTYTWSVTNGTGSASININGLLTAITDGTVTVTATANDGSGVTGNTIITISNQSVGIDDLSNIHKLTIYPNPAGNQLYIRTDEKIELITVVDVTGKTIKAITNNDSIDVSNLNGGIYFLQVKTNEGISSKKFLKK